MRFRKISKIKLKFLDYRPISNHEVNMRLLREETIVNNAATITALVQNSMFFSFRSSTKVVIIAAQNLGHAMSIAQSINLGPCIIETLDQKDGCTMYVQQYLSTKARETA